jgi:hypothetical protein
LHGVPLLLILRDLDNSQAKFKFSNTENAEKTRENHPKDC